MQIATHHHHKLNMSTNLTLAFFFTSLALFSFLLIFSPESSLITPKQRLNSIPENSLVHALVQESQHQGLDDQDIKHTKLPPPIGEEKCDLFKGHWVPEPRGPMYNSSSCATLPNWQNCLENGRTDNDFLHWRWKPDKCELPQFDPDNFLEFVRGKKMAFVGDSLAQGHVDSLLCLLSQEESPIEMYKDSEDRFGKWYFPQHNFTLMKLWSRHLIAATERMVNGTEYSGLFDLHLDKIDDKWGQHLPDLDYVIISGGHWFFRVMYLHQSGKLSGCVDCNQPNVTNYPRSHAVRMTFRTALKHIRICRNCKRDMVTLLRTFSPAHFENGAWNTGGYCNRTSPFDEFEADVNNFQSEWEVRGIQIEELERARKEAEEEKMPAEYGRKKFGVLDVTRAMMMRPDGHIGSFKYNPRLTTDCLHWCMPGPIDYWNNFLLEIIQKEGG